ncbi:sensor histidine kinase [Telmatospirillum sp. J64-1]|uniref:sensor histidine kinase n=1 Tax=Telmatospirillum sp. J64-1 TaxID=2502183 RepID=UPI00115E04BB|nr:sensor histidine kinase [Telmatospirillum sp. J64-1]
MTPRSLTRNLLFWLLAPLTLLSAALVGEAYVSSRATTELLYDQLLVSASISISEAVDLTYGDVVEEEVITLLRNTTSERIYYKIVGPDRSYVTGYEDFPHTVPDDQLEPGTPLLMDAVYQGQEIRALSLRFFHGDSLVEGWITIHVGMTKESQRQIIRDAVLRSILRLFGVVAVVALLAWIAVQRGLRPLQNFEAAMTQRSITDLRPIHHPLPRELQNIGVGVNKLLQRLDESIAAEKEFLANASHQLRSPLAALQLRTQLTLRLAPDEATRKALAKILEDTRHTTRLADQILAFSRADSSPPDLTHAGQVDLGVLVQSVVADHVPAALERGIDLGFSMPNTPLMLGGSSTLLREAVVNLVDNACKYVGEGGRIDVGLSRTAEGSIRLDVEDNGPGIPPHQREAVFRRFFRANDAAALGCGLGLAIAKRIIESHHGSIELHSRPDYPGTRFRVVFPLQSA